MKSILIRIFLFLALAIQSTLVQAQSSDARSFLREARAAQLEQQKRAQASKELALQVATQEKLRQPKPVEWVSPELIAGTGLEIDSTGTTLGLKVNDPSETTAVARQVPIQISLFKGPNISFLRVQVGEESSAATLDLPIYLPQTQVVLLTHPDYRLASGVNTNPEKLSTRQTVEDLVVGATAIRVIWGAAQTAAVKPEGFAIGSRELTSLKIANHTFNFDGETLVGVDLH